MFGRFCRTDTSYCLCITCLTASLRMAGRATRSMWLIPITTPSARSTLYGRKSPHSSATETRVRLEARCRSSLHQLSEFNDFGCNSGLIATCPRPLFRFRLQRRQQRQGPVPVVSVGRDPLLAPARSAAQLPARGHGRDTPDLAGRPLGLSLAAFAYACILSTVIMDIRRLL